MATRQTRQSGFGWRQAAVWITILTSGCETLGGRSPAVTSGNDTHTIRARGSYAYPQLRIYQWDPDFSQWAVVDTVDVTATPYVDPNDPNGEYTSGIYDMTASRMLAWNSEDPIQYRLVPMAMSSGVYVEDTLREMEFSGDGSAFELVLDTNAF